MTILVLLPEPLDKRRVPEYIKEGVEEGGRGLSLFITLHLVKIYDMIDSS